MLQQFVKANPPQWLLDLWREIDEKRFGQAFHVLVEDIAFSFGTGEWHGRDEVIANLKNSIRAWIHGTS